MKNIFKFATVAAAALAMLVSCEKTEGPKAPVTNEEEKAPLTIEGKQWICTYEGYTGNIPCVLDFGATKTGRMLVGVQEEEGKWVEDGMICDASYTIEMTSETSGVITYVSDYLLSLMGDEEMATEKLCFSDLTENSVKFSAHEDYPQPWLCLVFEEAATVSAEKITIEVLPVEGEDPASVSIDGKQWVTEMEGMGCFIDLGVKKAGMSYSGYVDLETLASLMGMSLGEYTVTATDATSGTININGTDMMTGEPALLAFPYKDLTETSVKIDNGIVYGTPSMGEVVYLDFTVASKTIEFEDMYENM